MPIRVRGDYGYSLPEIPVIHSSRVARSTEKIKIKNFCGTFYPERIVASFLKRATFKKCHLIKSLLDGVPNSPFTFSLVLFGLLGLIVFGIVAGFVDAWWEQRKRKKNERW